MGVVPHELGPYTEGVNLVDPITKLTPNELSKCLNFRTGIRGDFYKRPGHDWYGSAPAKVNGDALVNLDLRYYKSDGTKKRIVAAGGKLRYGNDSTGAWTDISINGAAASMSVSNLVDWMVYKDRLYLTDGVAAQRYNGTDDIYAGHYVHAAPTLVANTSGILPNGTYKYFVTSVTSDMGEGSKGAEASITLSGSNDGVSLSVMLSAPAKHNEVTKKIYRTKINGTLFYFLTEIPTATTTYSDNTIADTALGDEFIPSRIPPSNARFVIMGHDERAYWFGMPGVDASLVWVSDVGFPDRIIDDGSSGFFTVANNDGDIITGGGLVPGGIVFFKRSSMWLMRAFGYGLINIQPRDKRGGGVGSTAPFSIVSTPVGLFFLSQRGEIYRFDGTNIEEIGRKIQPQFDGMSESAMARIVACYHDYRYLISYDYRGKKGYNWLTMEFDTRANKWEGPHENGDYYNPSYYSVWDSVLDSGQLAWGEAKAANGSYVYTRAETNETDRGRKFLSLAQTGRPPIGKLGEVKTTKAFIDGRISGDASLTFTHIDEQNRRTSVNLNVPIAASGSLIGGLDLLGTTFILGGGGVGQVMEGPLGPGARARLPMYEISDGGTATDIEINNIMIKAEALELK